uniref:Golgin subfamily A member 6-like protein 22 n=1 Tax=Caenorhabditis tropicalis TaxID=1561998 RepID=A0A1I7UH31_9PELO
MATASERSIIQVSVNNRINQAVVQTNLSVYKAFGSPVPTDCFAIDDWVIYYGNMAEVEGQKARVKVERLVKERRVDEIELTEEKEIVEKREDMSWKTMTDVMKEEMEMKNRELQELKEKFKSAQEDHQKEMATLKKEADEDKERIRELEAKLAERDEELTRKDWKMVELNWKIDMKDWEIKGLTEMVPEDDKEDELSELKEEMKNLKVETRKEIMDLKMTLDSGKKDALIEQLKEENRNLHKYLSMTLDNSRNSTGNERELEILRVEKAGTEEKKKMEAEYGELIRLLNEVQEATLNDLKKVQKELKEAKEQLEKYEVDSDESSLDF